MRADPLLLAAPCGPTIRTGRTAHGDATATFDSTLRWRLRLSRVWDPYRPRLAFCMLNPSTADEQVLDPTVRRCWGYAQAWGAGSLEVVNAFALRSTDPRGLYVEPDPVGAGNDDAILAAGRDADLLILGWGTHAKLRDRHTQLLNLLADHQIPAAFLRLSKEGYPGHPLYLPSDLQPQWMPLH